MFSTVLYFQSSIAYEILFLQILDKLNKLLTGYKSAQICIQAHSSFQMKLIIDTLFYFTKKLSSFRAFTKHNMTLFHLCYASINETCYFPTESISVRKLISSYKLKLRWWCDRGTDRVTASLYIYMNLYIQVHKHSHIPIGFLLGQATHTRRWHDAAHVHSGLANCTQCLMKSSVTYSLIILCSYF